MSTCLVGLADPRRRACPPAGANSEPIGARAYLLCALSRTTTGLRLRPVLESEPQGARVRRNEQVVGADERSPLLQVRSNLGVVKGSGVAEIEHFDVGKE